jgi:hypothetical protein
MNAAERKDEGEGTKGIQKSKKEVRDEDTKEIFTAFNFNERFRLVIL